VGMRLKTFMVFGVCEGCVLVFVFGLVVVLGCVWVGFGVFCG